MPTIYINQLRALLAIAPRDDIRVYLNGVYFDSRGYAVATDGSCLLALRIPAFTGDSFIVGVADCECILKSAPAARGAMVVTPIDIDATTLRVLHHSIGYRPCDGRYPDWQRVVPTAVTGERVETVRDRNGALLRETKVEYSSLLLERFRDAFLLLAKSKRGTGANCTVIPNGSSAALVATGDDAVAVIMPVRDSGPKDFDAAKHVAEFLKVQP
jgi:hypothetical protein